MPAIAAFALMSVGALSACGGSCYKYPGTVAGNYTLMVTAISGSVTQTQSITLTVSAPNKQKAVLLEGPDQSIWFRSGSPDFTAFTQ